MTLSTLFALAALFVAVVALVKAREAAKRADGLSEDYWQLRYECGQMASKLRRLEEAGSSPVPEEQPGQRPIATAFVPLSSLKR